MEDMGLDLELEGKKEFRLMEKKVFPVGEKEEKRQIKE